MQELLRILASWKGITLEDGAEERLEAMPIGLSAEMAARVDHVGGHVRMRTTCVERGEARCIAQESIDDVLVLLGLGRARRVDEPAAPRDRRRRVQQHLVLRRSERNEVALGAPPADVGIASESTEAGTWRVHDDSGEGNMEGERARGVGLNQMDVVRSGRVHGPPEKCHPPLTDVAGDDRALTT